MPRERDPREVFLLNRIAFHELQQRLLSSVKFSAPVLDDFIEVVEIAINIPPALEAVDNLGADI